MKNSGIETKKTIDIFSYFTFACFMCTFKEIVDAQENICCKKNGGYRHEVRPFAFDLYEDQPLSDGAHLKQSYFFKSNEDTDICVMFSNCSDGWFTLVNVLSKAIQCEACLFSITSSDVLYGALNGFHYINNGKSIRTVYAMQDPHWVFYEDGKQLWFEDGNHYKQHTIKKRMNKEILVSYCTRLGFDIYSPQFWQSKQSVLLAELPRNRKK